MTTPGTPLRLVTDAAISQSWYGQLADRWRGQAAILDRYGASEQAVAIRAFAAELVEAGDTYYLETLTLKQAAEESGLSYSGLEKMVASGRLTNVGKEGNPRVRRGRKLPCQADSA